MKKHLLFIVALCISAIAYSQAINKPYEWRIKPGDVEWKNYKSRGEMAVALQIPDSVLKRLSTEALAKTCIAFPMFIDLIYFNKLQDGFNTLKKSFNGFNELLNRKDAFPELYKIYLSINPSDIQNYEESFSKGKFAFELLSLETLLAQPEIINGAIDREKSDLVKTCLEKYEAKKTAYYSPFTSNVSLLVIARVLHGSTYLKKIPGYELAEFEQSGTANSADIIDQIYLSAKSIHSDQK